MTAEEAIKLLKEAPIMGINRENSDLPLAEAVALAINSLENQINTAEICLKLFGNEPPCNFNDLAAYCDNWCEANCDKHDFKNCWEHAIISGWLSEENN